MFHLFDIRTTYDNIFKQKLIIENDQIDLTQEMNDFQNKSSLEVYESVMRTELGKAVENYFSENSNVDPPIPYFSSLKNKIGQNFYKSFKEIDDDFALLADQWSNFLGFNSPVSLSILTLKQLFHEKIEELQKSPHVNYHDFLIEIKNELNEIIPMAPNSLSEYQKLLSQHSTIPLEIVEPPKIPSRKSITKAELCNILTRLLSLSTDEDIIHVVDIFNRYEPKTINFSGEDLCVNLEHLDRHTIHHLRTFLLEKVPNLPHEPYESEAQEDMMPH